MIRQCPPQGTRPSSQTAAISLYRLAGASAALLAALVAARPVSAQVITIDSKTGAVTNGTSGHAGTVDRRYAQIEPTKVPLTQSELDAKTRLELIRLLQSEQGFAMRPFPRGHKGLTLNANGKLVPAGEEYLSMVTSEGLSAKPGDRVVLTDIKFEHSRIVFQLNGGPDKKHRFLSHIELGTGQVMNPVAQADGQDPVGARLTLAFPKGVPDMTDKDVKALLAPLISFDVKTPVEAFTDTLPTKLKEAILNHHVMVGMSTDMVLFAKGAPEIKSREMDGQMPFEEWIYGKPPKEVDFVRINGNRVIRVEIAKTGEEPVIFTKDEVEGLMRTDGTPVETASSNTRTVEEGDVVRNPDTQAPATPPSLRKPGEEAPDKLPNQDDPGKRVGVMLPVQFPKQKPDESPDASGLPRSPQPDEAAPAAPTTPTTQTNGSQPKPADPAPPAAAPPANTQPPAGGASQAGTSKPQPGAGAGPANRLV
jgi:hypothetical protein